MSAAAQRQWEDKKYGHCNFIGTKNGDIHIWLLFQRDTNSLTEQSGTMARYLTGVYELHVVLSSAGDI